MSKSLRRQTIREMLSSHFDGYAPESSAGQVPAKKLIVISGVNLVEGGTLTVFKEALCALSELSCIDQYEVCVLVHRKELFSEFDGNFHLLEYPESKNSWLTRIWIEYFGFKRDFKGIDISWWISMHDMSPRVSADNQAVYCHNCTQFYKATYRDFLVDQKFYLFCKFYRYLYRINIRSNRYVIVQQEWMRSAFQEEYSIDNVIVAKPKKDPSSMNKASLAHGSCGIARFVFPALPRPFKNFETICEAAKILKLKGIVDFEVVLTIDGTENAYAKNIYRNYCEVANVRFAGFQDQERMAALYEEATCLIFPSKLESWGMPISEFGPTGKPMILADLPYAHEAAEGYGPCSFFDPNDPDALAMKMEQVLNDGLLDFFLVAKGKRPEAESWSELFDMLLTKSGD